MHHAYAAVTACRPAGSDICQQVANNFLGTYAPGVGVTAGLLQVIPALIGAFAGAPVLARELETGTFRYAWTQGFGRARWTIAKLAPLAIAVTVAAGAFSVLVSWYFQPIFGAGDDNGPLYPTHLRPARRCARRLDAGRVRDRRPGRHPDPPGHPRNVRHPRRVGRARLRDRPIPAPALRGAAGHQQPQHSRRRVGDQPGVVPGRQSGEPGHDQPDPRSGRRPGGDARTVPTRALDPGQLRPRAVPHPARLHAIDDSTSPQAGSGRSSGSKAAGCSRSP